MTILPNKSLQPTAVVILQKEERISARAVWILWSCIIGVALRAWLIAAIGASGLSDK